jgi:Tfp pilus assembly protein PilF
MSISNTQIFCQNCRAANSLSETHCQNCGVRLLLVIFPSSLQYDTNHVPSFYEDHLLERVSLLELRLLQVTESLQGTLEIIREQGKFLKEQKDLIKSLYEIFGLLKTEETERVRKAWDEMLKKRQTGKANSIKNDEIYEKILAEHDLPNVELFSHLFSEGTKFLTKGEEKQGFQMIERALMLSPNNLSLHLFYTEKLFVADKFDEAKKYLEKAVKFAPNNPIIRLILGAIYADEGETEKARRNLSLLINDEKKTLIINYIWGFLAASEENWTESLAAFKQVSEVSQAIEIEYLIGCAYFQLGRFPMALRNFEKSVKVDKNYADAWFMKSIIFKLQKDKKRENESFAKALQAKESGAQCSEFLKGKKHSNPETALPFRHFKQKKTRLLTSGSIRLSKFFRGELVNAIK